MINEWFWACCGCVSCCTTSGRAEALWHLMIPHLFYDQRVVLGLLWLCILLYYSWPSRGAVAPPGPVKPAPITPQRQRSQESKRFVGLLHKPLCALCEHEATHAKPQPPLPPDLLPPTNCRPRGIDTSRHFCPHGG